MKHNIILFKHREIEWPHHILQWIIAIANIKRMKYAPAQIGVRDSVSDAVNESEKKG